MKEKFFRCVMVKKTETSIKDSQWQTIKDVVDQWGLESLFRFKTSPLSIECVNGNKFIARGCEDAAKLKSIKDPTDVWYEEGNQLDLSDFITVATTLRSNKSRTQQWFSFNPETEGDFEDFWLYKSFFSTYSETGDIYKNFISTWSVQIPEYTYIQPQTGVVHHHPASTVNFTYNSTWTTYHDNKYCKPERGAFLEQLAILDPYYYKVFTLGKWGNRKNDDPFCYTFDQSKHIKPTQLNRAYEVKASFDFNVNPITCTIFQDYIPNTIYGIESIKLENSDIYKLCDYINVHYPGCLFVITGDATGRATTALVQDGINYYTVIKSKLNLSSGQIKVPSVNPKVKENRVLVNAVFHTMNVALDPVKCKGLIYDCENVSVNDMGDIDKGDRSNPKKRADHLDNFRYYCNSFHRNVLKS